MPARPSSFPVSPIGFGILSLAALILPVCAAAQPLPGNRLPGLPRATQGSERVPAADAASQRKEQRRQADLVKAVLGEIEGFVPDHRAFVANSDQAQAEAARALEDFRERMARSITADLIAMANDSTNSYATRVAADADRHADYTARSIAAVDLARFRNSTGRDDLAIAQYFLMAYRAEQLNQLARLYPQSRRVGEARATATAAMTELGSLASVKKGRAAAQAARVAAMRLYPAVRSDPATERDFAAAFRSSIWTQGDFAGSEILRVHLLSQGWTVRRNPITGIILSRDQRADLGVKRKDGKCFSYVIELEQQHQGAGFGRTRMASGREMEMLCENLAR